MYPFIDFLDGIGRIVYKCFLSESCSIGIEESGNNIRERTVEIEVDAQKPDYPVVFTPDCNRCGFKRFPILISCKIRNTVGFAAFIDLVQHLQCKIRYRSTDLSSRMVSIDNLDD